MDDYFDDDHCVDYDRDPDLEDDDQRQTAPHFDDDEPWMDKGPRDAGDFWQKMWDYASG